MTYLNKYKNAGQRGVALYLAVMITSLILGVALGVASLFLKQIVVLRGLGNSVFALLSSDSGIEKILMIDNQTCSDASKYPDRAACVQSQAALLGAVSLSNGATYKITVDKVGQAGCATAQLYCATSVGMYADTRRAIRIAR